MKKRKIVHIISSLKRGGAESLLVDLLQQLPQFEHHVIYFHPGPNVTVLNAHGIVTYHLKGLLCLYDFVFFIRLFRFIKKLQPSCIHSGLWAANLAARLVAYVLRIPLVSVIHLGIHQDGRVRNFFDTVSFWMSQHIVAVSNEVADSLKKRRWVPAERISIIPNGISAEHILQETKNNPCSRKELGIPDNAFVIGSVGRFIPRKNYAFLLDVFASLRELNAYLVLVGFGPEEQALRTRASILGIQQNVRFIINKPAYGYYPLFNCFVLPSLQEGISIALLEAMTYGLPVLVTTQAPAHEVITHKKNGLLVPSNNAQKLRSTLLSLYQTPEIAANLGKEALHSINTTFSMERMKTSYEELFNKIIF